MDQLEKEKADQQKKLDAKDKKMKKLKEELGQVNDQMVALLQKIMNSCSENHEDVQNSINALKEMKQGESGSKG